MSLLINIANIPILIKGGEFLKALNPIEANLLRPFIKIPPANLKKKTFLIKVKIVNNKSLARVSPQIIEKLRLFFPNNNDDRFRRFFLYAVKRILTQRIVYNRITHLLSPGQIEANRIILGNSSLLAFNRNSSQCNIYYRKLIFSKTQSHLFDERLFNLGILRLSMRALLNTAGGGVLLHASSVEDRDSGYVFIGHSGSGKSTVTKILKPERILSDETTIIRRTNSIYNLYPNPWWNADHQVKIHKPNTPVQLKAIFFIKKSAKTNLKKLNYKEALAMFIYGDMLFQQTNFFDNKSGIRDFYLFIQQLICDIPIFELSIKKSHKFREDFFRLIGSYL